jgi:hypothetical protein
MDKTKVFFENGTVMGRNALQRSFGAYFALQPKRLATPDVVVDSDNFRLLSRGGLLRFY